MDVTLRYKLSQLPGYSQELGLDLANGDHRFGWFVAAVLLTGGVSSQIAKDTYRKLQSEGMVTLDTIVEAGWDRLVEVLDAGGYVVYDFATASKILDMASKLKERYGSLEELYLQAKNERDLVKRLQEFRGVGPTTVNTFLRELKAIWAKAKPDISPVAMDVASRLGLCDEDLEQPAIEIALARVGVDFCRARQCLTCPVQGECSDPYLR